MVKFLGGVAAVALGLVWAADGSAAPVKAAAVLPESAAMLTFDVFLPVRHEAELDRFLAEVQKEGSPLYHQFLTPEQYRQRFGAAPEIVAGLRGILVAAGLEVKEHASSLRVSGPAASVEKLLGTRLGVVTRADGHTKIVATGAIKLPAAFEAAGASLVAFNARTPHKQTFSTIVDRPLNRNGPEGGYWYNDLKQAYDYPAYTTKVAGKTLNGQGVSIGILMSSDVLDSDIKGYFDHEHFATTTGTADPAVFSRVYPDIVPHTGATADPNNDAYVEATLDVEESLGGSPGADLYLFNIPDLDDDSIIAALVDEDEDNLTDILSMSFGECEKDYSAAYNDGQNYDHILRTFHQLFKQGASQGITFIASSGDSAGLICPNVNYINDGEYGGHSGGPYKFVKGVSTPASDPFVTSVGGTNLETTPPPGAPNDLVATPSLYVSENAEADPEVPYDPYGFGIPVTGGYWGASGGISDFYPRPDYQALVTTGSLMRTNPDVGMMVGGCPGGLSESACPATNSKHPIRSYVLIYTSGCGSDPICGVIGTSVSAPEFAGAVGLRVQKFGRQGSLNMMLYTKAARQTDGGVLSYHREIPGFDGVYYTDYRTDKYNYMTGNGTPRIRQLMGFADAEPAGNPRTATNP